ncbi:MAG: hypothetical protein KDC87_05915 [Planctomycetes bacterium]|nr:hypothetical protein [Planctomycetota bacterium]
MANLRSFLSHALAVALTVGLASTALAAPQDPALDARGERLAAAFTRQLDSLRAELQRSLPQVSERRRAAYHDAQQAVKAAEAELASAQQELGKVGTAKALVDHAKGKWIGGADRGIAQAEVALAKAATDAEREAARADLAKWQQNRRDGEQALKERQATLDQELREEPGKKRAVEAAEQQLARAQQAVLRSVEALRLGDFLASDRLDERFARFVVLSEATPTRLARFAQQGAVQQALVESMLEDSELLLQMVVADGAREGEYGRAMEIYRAIQAASPKAAEGALQRLALAIALEHAVPIVQRDPATASQAEGTVDPVARYRHYEAAFAAGELDPAFDALTVWDYRMVVDGDEPDATLAWGREMLRAYRPDHVFTKDYNWRYVAAVRTDIRYGSDDNRFDKSELQFYQNILMNGGVCGRRAFFGRFILRAFGIPTTARPQRGHAALVHWTPKGWVCCLGAGWGSGWTKTRYDRDLDFLATTQARADRDAFLQVKRAQWAGDVSGERPVYGLHGKAEPGFWYGVSLRHQQQLIEEQGAVTLAAVGEELGEANESHVVYATEAAEVTDEDRRIVMEDGAITIPAVATSEPTRSGGRILFLPSNLGGKQLHYQRTGRAQPFEYTLLVPAAGRYALTARVATPSWQQHLMVSVKGTGGEPVDLALPHTVGLWGETQPVEIELPAGSIVLRFEHRSDGQEKGFSVKDFTLRPLVRRGS